MDSLSALFRCFFIITFTPQINDGKKSFRGDDIWTNRDVGKGGYLSSYICGHYPQSRS